MSIIKLKSSFIKDIEDDPVLLGTIAVKIKRHTGTIARWIKEDHEMLTHYSVLKTISEYKGLAIEDLIENHTVEDVESNQFV